MTLSCLLQSRRSLGAVVVVLALGTLTLAADRAEAQSLSLTGGMTLLLGPPDGTVLGPPQDGQVVQQPPQQPPQQQPVYIVETQPPPGYVPVQPGYGQPGYGQPGYGQPGYSQQGAMGPSGQASQQAQQESNGRIGRVILGPVMGFSVGWSLGVVGMLIGMVAGDCFDLGGGGWDSSCVVGIVAGAYTGLLLGIPLGVMWAGSWFHGMGSFGSAFLGTLAGTGIAVLISALVQNYDAVVGAALLPVAGAVIGYELSSSANASASLAGLALTPTFDRGALTGATAGVRFAF